jgi:hypothetical protein
MNDQRQQQVEGLGRERHTFTVTLQSPLSSIHAELAELITLICVFAHTNSAEVFHQPDVAARVIYLCKQQPSSIGGNSDTSR